MLCSPGAGFVRRAESTLVLTNANDQFKKRDTIDTTFQICRSFARRPIIGKREGRKGRAKSNVDLLSGQVVKHVYRYNLLLRKHSKRGDEYERIGFRDIPDK